MKRSNWQIALIYCFILFIFFLQFRRSQRKKISMINKSLPFINFLLIVVFLHFLRCTSLTSSFAFITHAPPNTLIHRSVVIIQSETKSILTDGDWKKLWMEAGNTNANLKKDNSIDSSDSPIFDDTEVSDRHLFAFAHSITKYLNR